MKSDENRGKGFSSAQGPRALKINPGQIQYSLALSSIFPRITGLP